MRVTNFAREGCSPIQLNYDIMSQVYAVTFKRSSTRQADIVERYDFNLNIPDRGQCCGRHRLLATSYRELMSNNQAC